MITVGLIKELLFISKALRVPIRSTLKTEKINSDIVIDIKERILTIHYLGYHIWTETLDEAISMFGPESCDTLARIIYLIDVGDSKAWQTLKYDDRKDLTN